MKNKPTKGPGRPSEEPTKVIRVPVGTLNEIESLVKRYKKRKREFNKILAV